VIVWCVLTSATRIPAADAPPTPAPLEVGKAERLLVVAPHPDDETLGAGGLAQRVLARGGTVRVVVITAGDGYVEGVRHATGEPVPRPRELVAYGARRLREARAALRELGGGRIRLQILGFPDGGLEGLLAAHWRRAEPERSRTTYVSKPPYAGTLDPSVAYDGSDLRQETAQLMRDFAPSVVAFPDPLDRHPDHAATGLFAMLALGDWLPRAPTPGASLPRLLAYLVHWPGWPPDWDAPDPPPERSDVALDLPADLPTRGLARTALTLTDGEVARKRGALARHVTQQEVSPAFLAAFVHRTEPFTVMTLAEVEHADGLIAARAAPAPGPTP
jgi:LmbE family N-acetylglucosaminyl deacetylase